MNQFTTIQDALRSAAVNAGIAAYGFSPGDLRSIEREVAFKLIPRLKAA